MARLLSALVLISLVTATTAHAHIFAVRGDQMIGAYAVRADGSLAGAIRAFGEPSSRRSTFGTQACNVAWQRHGLTIAFYNLGLGQACEPDAGRFGRAILRGEHWMTTKRLRVGESVTKLRRLYPTAKLEPGLRGFWPTGYWLLPRYSRLGEGGFYPGLLANVRNGRIVEFQVRFAGGGD